MNNIMKNIHNKTKGSIFRAPERANKEQYSVFLAGSIDMGNAVDWQSQYENEFKKYRINIYNPRRIDFNNKEKQSINNPYFKEQVTWELEHLEKSECIIYHFANNSQSVITLLELGKFSNFNNKKIFVYAQEYFRLGNLEIFCDRYKLPLYNNEKNMLRDLHELFKLKTYSYL